MKRFNLFLFLTLSFFNFALNAQEDIESKQANPVFTAEERDSLQLWFYDRATAMGLQGEKRDSFYNIILYNSSRIRKLVKREEDMNQDELVSKFEALMDEQNNEIRPLLNEKQYEYYLETYSKMLDSVYRRRGWQRKMNDERD
jgi:hypothetical protein